MHGQQNIKKEIEILVAQNFRLQK